MTIKFWITTIPPKEAVGLVSNQRVVSQKWSETRIKKRREYCHIYRRFRALQQWGALHNIARYLANSWMRLVGVHSTYPHIQIIMGMIAYRPCMFAIDIYVKAIYSRNRSCLVESCRGRKLIMAKVIARLFVAK